MTPDDLVERVARAMCAPFDPDEMMWIGRYIKRWETHRDQGRAAIAEIRAALDEPNEAMLAAARRINHATDAEIWRAMLAASPLGGAE
jgi:hypothetical protein